MIGKKRSPEKRKGDKAREMNWDMGERKEIVGVFKNDGLLLQ